MAERLRRLGRMKQAQSPAMTRSIGRRFGARSRGLIEDQQLVLDEQ